MSNGSVFTQQSVPNGSLLTQPADPTRAGYRFMGWYKEYSLINAWNFDADVVTSNRTLYAKWVTVTYTVTFESNGGSAVGQQTATANRKIAAPTTPVRSGHTFNGWYKEAALTNAWNFASDTVTSNLTLYAKWTAGSYTLTFDAQGGTVATASKPVTYGVAVGELPPTPTRTGYAFDGWYTQPDGAGTRYTATTVYSEAGNTTLYAKWTALSSDARLRSLTVSAGTLSPDFNANITAYTVNVAYSVSSISISATQNHSGATVIGAGSKTLNAGANAFNVVVTAQDGVTQKTYTLTVTRASSTASTDATLSSLTVSAGSLSPAFSANTTAYTVSVADSVSSITISAAKNHAGATMSGDVGSQSLNFGENIFSIELTAQDAATTKTYTVTVTREAPVFTGDFESATSGWVFVNGSQTNQWIVGTATAASGSKSAYISNDEASNTYSRNSSSVVHLYHDVFFTPSTAGYLLSFDWKGAGESGYDFMGVYLVETSVNPEAGALLSSSNELSRAFGGGNSSATWRHASLTLPSSYSGTTKRLVFTWRNDGSDGTQPPIAIDNVSLSPVSTDATLSSLTVSAGMLSPTFSANDTAYTVNVANSVSGITISAVKNHSEATVSGTGNKNLSVGANTFSVSVTAQDGVTQKTYTVTVNRASSTASSDATLSSLTVSAGNLSPAFNANTTVYTVSVANSVSSITISAAANHAGATVSGAGSKSLNVGANTFNVVVNAQDGVTQKTYTVTVTREVASADATLSSLTVSAGTLSPAFSANTTAYTVSVANSVSSITISAAANHTGATVSGAGSKSLNVGANAFSVVVTAQNGTTQKTYTVTVTRQSPGATGVEDAAQAKIALYPNPVVNGELRVESEALKAGEKIAIYSISGALVGRYEVSGTVTVINVSHLAAGTYIVKAGKHTAKIAVN
jgi:uncharacterized repeat protein (TIGR02543 family)